MKVPVIGTIDERFLTHRLRSTSNGGMAGLLVAAAFFFYNLSRHLIRWDLFAVIATAAIVKISFLIYYRVTD
jgi:hypothetical protein